MRVELQPAYLLHSRKISDSRLLVDFFTRDYGVVGAVARAPSKKKPAYATFSPALVSWLGKGGLKTLVDYELTRVSSPRLAGVPLYCGFYLNELLQRLLPKGEACPALFEAYRATIAELSHTAPHPDQAVLLIHLEPLLREFELRVLEELGYLVDFSHDASTGQPLEEARRYYLDVNSGFSEVGRPAWPTFDGKVILAMGQRDFSDTTMLGAMKMMTRVLLSPVLGSKPLKSRELFASVKTR
ncbi:MAG TPA: DNA repair protein RecO [Marinagarivorans sp.]